MTQLMGTEITKCFDRGVAMIIKIKNAEGQLEWAKYFQGSILESESGSFTDVPAIKIPMHTIDGKFRIIGDGLGLAYLEYTDKNNNKDKNKNMMVVFKISDGSILNTYLFQKTIPISKDIVFAPLNMDIGKTDQDIKNFYVHQILQRDEIDYRVHFNVWAEAKNMVIGNSINSMDNKFGATSIVEWKYYTYVGGAVSNINDPENFKPAIYKVYRAINYFDIKKCANQGGNCYDCGGNIYYGTGTSLWGLKQGEYDVKQGVRNANVKCSNTNNGGPFKPISSGYKVCYCDWTFANGDFKGYKIAYLPEEAGTNGYSVDGMTPTRGDDFLIQAFALPRDKDFKQVKHAYFYQIIIWPEKVTDSNLQFEVFKIQHFSTKRYRQFHYLNHVLNRMSYVFTEDDTMEGLSLISGRNLFFYDMDGRHFTRDSVGNMKFKNAKGEMHFVSKIMTDDTTTTNYRAKIGRHCYKHSEQPYCQMIQMKPQSMNEETLDKKHAAYAVTTTHYFEDTSWSDQLDCMSTYAQPGPPKNGVTKINGNAQKTGKAIMIVLDTYAQSCFQVHKYQKFERQNGVMRLYEVPTRGMDHDAGKRCDDLTYTTAETSDHLKTFLPAPVWKQEDVTVGFKTQYDVTKTSNTGSAQQCPKVLTYHLSKSKTQLTPPTFPKTAYFDIASGEYKILFPKKTLDGKSYVDDLYLVQTVGFDASGSADNGKFKIVQQKVTPQLFNYHYYPSCKPGCLQESKTKKDAMYKMMTTGKCYRALCNAAESSLLDPDSDTTCMESVDCLTPKYCAAADKFKVKEGTPTFKWNFEASDFPSTKTKLFDHLELSSTVTPELYVREKQSGSDSWTDLVAATKNSIEVPDKSKDTIKFKGTTEMRDKELQIMYKHSYQCFFNDKQAFLNLDAYLEGKVSIDFCKGQQVLLVKEERLFKAQRITGTRKLIKLTKDYFKVKDDSRCAITKVEVLDDKGQALSGILSNFLVVGELNDPTKLPLSYNTNAVGSTITQIFNFQIKASTNGDQNRIQKVKIIIGCFEMKQLKVKYKEKGYDFVSKGDPELFVILADPKQKSADASVSTLLVDLKKVMDWSTEVADCYQSKVSICLDVSCQTAEVPSVKMESVTRNDETGEIGDMVLSISTLQPTIQNFFIKSEIPSGTSVLSNVRLIVCGQEKLTIKGGKNRNLNYLSKDKWQYFKLDDLFRLEQEEKSNCPITGYQLCKNRACSSVGHDSKKFSLQSEKFGINIAEEMENEKVFLQAITKGQVAIAIKFKVTVIKPKEPEEGEEEDNTLNFAPSFTEGLGEVESIKVSQGTGELTFESNKATDFEKNKITIEIKETPPTFVTFEMGKESFKVIIDRAKITAKDEGTSKFTVILTDDKSTLKGQFTFTIEVEKSSETKSGDLSQTQKEEDNNETDKEQSDEVISSNTQIGTVEGSDEITEKKENSDKTKSSTQEQSQSADEDVGCDPSDIECLQKEAEAQSEAQSEGSQEGQASDSSKKKQVNPIDQAKLDYILSMLKARAAAKEKASQAGGESEEDEPEPPKILAAWIEEIDNMGKMTVKFNQTLDTKLLPAADQINRSIIKMKIEPAAQDSDDFNATKFEFDWEAISVNPDESTIVFQLNFYEPLYISAEEKQDEVLLEWRQPWLFQGVESGLFIDQQFTKLKASVGKQMINDEAAENLKGSTEAASKAFETATIFIFIGQIILKGVLKKLMGALVLLQFIIHMGILSVQYPGNILLFSSQMRPIISFDIMKYLGELNKVIFSFDYAAQKEMREQNMIGPLKDMGFKFTNCIINLGLFGQIIFLFLVQAIMLSPVLKVLSLMTKNQRIKKWEQEVTKRVFFSMIIQIVIKGFMPISIAVYLNYVCAVYTTSGEMIANSFATICFFLSFVAIPAMMLLVVVVPKGKLQDPLFKQRYGSLYGNTRVENRLQRLYSLVFVSRRFMLIYLGLLFSQNPGIQAQSIMMLNLSMMIYTALNRPFKTIHENWMDKVNESYMLCLCYNLFIFTNWIDSKEMQYEMAWNYIYIIGAMIITNSLYVIATLKRRVELIVIKYYRRLVHRFAEPETVKEVKTQDLVPSIEELQKNKEKFQGKYRSSGYRDQFKRLRKIPTDTDKPKYVNEITKSKTFKPIARKTFVDKKQKPVIIQPARKSTPLPIIQEKPELADVSLEDSVDSDLDIANLEEKVQQITRQNEQKKNRLRRLESLEEELNSLDAMITKL